MFLLSSSEVSCPMRTLANHKQLKLTTCSTSPVNLCNLSIVFLLSQLPPPPFLFGPHQIHLNKGNQLLYLQPRFFSGPWRKVISHDDNEYRFSNLSILEVLRRANTIIRTWARVVDSTEFINLFLLVMGVVDQICQLLIEKSQIEILIDLNLS